MDLTKIRENANHPTWTNRFLAAKTIGDNKITKGIDILIELLEDENEQVRIATVNSVTILNNKKAIDPLINALADPNEWVRVNVVNALGKIGAKKHLPLLAQFLENEEEDKVRATIIRVLGEHGGKELSSIIVHYLKDPNDRVRANAVEALESIGGSNMDENLKSLINDKSNRVKANTAKALFNSGSKDAIEILKDMILSSDDWMRASAAYVFGEIDSPHSIPYLLKALEDKTWFVIKNGVKGIAKKGEKAVPELINCINSHNKELVINALSALEEICSEKCLIDLIKLLYHEDGDIREKTEQVVDIIREKKNFHN